jgi:hypothetical protein
MRTLLRFASAAAGLGVVVLGAGVSVDGCRLFLAEVRSPYYSFPVWKAAAIVMLLLATAFISLFACYRLLSFAVVGKK